MEATVSNETLQDHLLAGVSRTFALTIPQLPPDLARVVGNAYLLCRTVDTIEDEPALDWSEKRRLCDLYVEAIAGRSNPRRFVRDIVPLLSAHTPAPERELIQATPRVLTITHGFAPAQRAALSRCVEVMAAGMVEFQANSSLAGLADRQALDRYCYYVAGCVGEMLTELFCHHSPAIARHRDTLLPLAVDFGQGLQMTNILKDIWDDRARGMCWLPRSVFREAGFELDGLRPGCDDAAFARGLGTLIGIAHGHLRKALDYTLLIPPDQTGIRSFCLWSVGMALLTLRKLNRRRDFDSGRQVKISRNSVRATILISSLTVRHDALLRRLFDRVARGLPGPY